MDSGLSCVHTKSDGCPTVLGLVDENPVAKPFVPPHRGEDPCCFVKQQGSLVALSL